MLIYLQPPVQQKVLSRFHFALNRGGIAFLGPSETPGALASEFIPIDKHWRIYRKHSDVRVPIDTRVQPRVESRLVTESRAAIGRAPPSQLLGTYDALLDELLPPSLLVNDRGELVHSFAGASRFIRPRDGRQALDLLDLVDDELKMVLAGGLARARKAGAAVVFNGVHVKSAAGEGAHKVTIRRITAPRGGLPHILISFEELANATPRAPRSETEISLDQVSREQLGALQHELSYTKENLQAAVEELEASNEELQASNEELLASNEELQSTNEELQSVNEELYTVNAEYQRKIAELTELTNDMDNLLSSTDIGTIFLDSELRIRKFTPQIAETFNLLPQDVGRSIETFTNTMERPQLNADVRRVLATGETFECELRDRRGRAFFLRILPYRAKGSIAGVVIIVLFVAGARWLVQRLELLHSPTLAILLTVVVMVMLGTGLAADGLGLARLAHVSLFPIAVLAITAERFYLSLTEHGARSAVKELAGTLGVMAACYAVMSSLALEILVVGFPEVMLAVIAADIYLGRWVGMRLSEYGRFRKLLFAERAP